MIMELTYTERELFDDGTDFARKSVIVIPPEVYMKPNWHTQIQDIVSEPATSFKIDPFTRQYLNSNNIQISPFLGLHNEAAATEENEIEYSDLDELD